MQTAKAILLYSLSYLLLSHYKPAGTKTAMTSLLSSRENAMPMGMFTCQGKYSTNPLLRLKSIVFRQIYYAISGNLGSNFPMFL